MPSKCLLIKWTVSLHYLISTALVWLISLGESPPFVTANTLLSWNLSFSVTEFTSNWVQWQFRGRRWTCSGAGERRRGSARDWQHGWVGDEVAPEAWWDGGAAGQAASHRVCGTHGLAACFQTTWQTTWAANKWAAHATQNFSVAHKIERNPFFFFNFQNLTLKHGVKHNIFYTKIFVTIRWQT